MKYYAYLIEWIDSNCNLGWRPLEDQTKAKECMIRSIGFMVHKDEHLIAITTSVSAGGRGMDMLSIPRVAIKTMKRLPQYVE